MSRSTSSSSTTEPVVPADRLEIGHIRRPHGLRGDVHVQLTTDVTSRLDVGAHVFMGDRRLTVTACREAGAGKFIVHFAEIGDRTEAERHTNAALTADPIDDPDAIWVHELIGARVVDQHGVDHGPCVAVVANPASDLIELESGFLVPSVFATSLADGVVQVDVPDGLFD